MRYTMRHAYLVGFSIVSVQSGLYAALAMAEDADKAKAYLDKTIELRSGKITLAPTQGSPPARQNESAPVASNADGGAHKRSRARAVSPSAVPGIAEDAVGPATAPHTINKPITTERVILSFERRVTEAERLALGRNGIWIGDFLGGTNYNARVNHTSTTALVHASQDIIKVQHVVALDNRNAHIKVDPAIVGRMSAQSTRRVPPGAEQSPVNTAMNVSVQLWPETDVEKLKLELGALGQVTRVSPRTHKIELVLSNAANVEVISKLAGVQYIAPSYGVKSQNTHAARNVGADVAAAAPHLLSGNGVRVGIWDGGHVAADHPSFTGRLAVDLTRENTRRHDNQHATHVAGTIAGTGEFVAPATSSTAGNRRAKESEIPVYGDELVVKPNRRAGRFAPTTAGEASTARSVAPRTQTEAEAEPRYPGIAVGSQILSYDFFGAAEEVIDLLIDKPDAIDVMNNSWSLNLDPVSNPGSCDQMATYVMEAPDFDAAVSGDNAGQALRRIPIIFAAGNARNDGVCNLSSAAGFPNFRSVLPPSTAKNVITVGAVDADTNAMTDFSSWGPTASGRLKPDIVAPGCRLISDGESGIVSAIPAKGIGRMCGTSMATPVVTGVVSLMIEKMVKLGQTKTSVFPSTYKALLIHGAEDLGRPGPDFEYGYGRVRLPATLNLMDDKAFLQATIKREGEVQSYEIQVAPGASEIKATLVWDDRPTGVFSDETLSNDLDLVLVSPSGQTNLPFVLNAVPGKETELAQPAVDRLNVVEQVLVRQPIVGIWRIEVRASKVGSPTGGQTYSLVSSVQ